MHLRHLRHLRELGIVEAYKNRGGMVPANLTIRVSATMVDGDATRAWPTTSGVHTVATKGLREATSAATGQAMSDIVERLKHTVDHYTKAGCPNFAKAESDAIDEIERLTDEARTDAHTIVSHADKIRHLEAENAKLRAKCDELFKSNAELAEIIAALQERARYDQSQWY